MTLAFPLPRATGRWLAVAVIGLALSACAQTRSFVQEDPSRQPAPGARVLIMPPDVEVSELTAAGLLEPNAAWTAAAEANIDSALESVLGEFGAKAVRFNPNGNLIRKPEVSQLIKLHGAVGGSILLHQYINGLQLPNKNGRFDWTLGKDAAIVGKAYKARYALFVFFRDSFSSGARMALNVIAGTSGGQQVGFASLVDLTDGDIVWFNVLHSTTGDLREAEAAREASRTLLSELPL